MVFHFVGVRISNFAAENRNAHGNEEETKIVNCLSV